MKKILVLLVTVIVACGKESKEFKNCDYDNILGGGLEWSGSGNEPFPLHSLNFWTFSDSVFSTDGVLDTVKTTLIQIDLVYRYGNNYVIGFTEMLPQMLVRNDTLFGVQSTPRSSAPACFEIYDPILFATKDTVQINQQNRIFFSTETVKTGAGTFSGNLVLQVSDYWEYIFNEQVGILKITMRGYNGNGEIVKRKVLTLKDYAVY
jgi:hypothetical protein